ncbi:MAG: FAD-binding oxidoreductase [Hoeflea sp.]|uniref:NAD(P)/FAD-dependent oxidoreductase n=1 Tax=Hoeflea sp. TaxID=1940281 RepID=UPI001D9AD6E2|nr:FAD-dependent oxidoreductase [Hoeflea sp.]MBU4527652.1 FAD-binding oxidoreductase [Alphaproteobacteria bacterium]MBU4546480.1 FAD-binding oxidoreductase [Alphaproteobacteria bacterium]MBU4553002.1 FAD-binding oxidoreductase [Alphaproteobacteria bacterium]MBV1724074.1 FAD-binding oxidoreductase [Hoeflea sp.]MBV1759759.1 FAD-binding oxidoreductase [Hoeflea sp.]
MAVADSGVGRSGQAPDLLIAGAGVAGLWLTVKAARAGLSVLLVEPGNPGCGASGGFLGALMPHSPERWNGKKDFQFKALVDLEEEVARLESETGALCGYRRVGRILPLTSERGRAAALDQIADARTNWGDRFSYEVHHAPERSGWPDMLRAPHGVVHERLSARLSPPGLIGALLSSLAVTPNVELRLGVGVMDVIPGEHKARLSDGSMVNYGHIALANGVDAFPLIARAAGLPANSLGGGVKGQAALLDARASPDLPLVYDDGIYVIVHENGHVAVGSTSEREFDDPVSTDGQLDEIVKRARKLCPVIKHAPVIRRWAGVRPRAIGRDPMLGPVPGAPNVLAMAGGFKISFGIAHRMADCLVAGITGSAGPAIPQSFAVEYHAAKAAGKTAAN